MNNLPTTDKPIDVRLGKRLAYILRYGAEKEGLQVKEGGKGFANVNCHYPNCLRANILSVRNMFCGLGLN